MNRDKAGKCCVEKVANNPFAKSPAKKNPTTTKSSLYDIEKKFREKYF